MTSAFTTIVVATDFGPTSDAALRTGATLARQLQASLHLLHVVREPIPAISAPEMYGIDWLRLRDDMVAQAASTLDRLASSLKGQPVTTHVIVGAAAEGIASQAREMGADLIVMGTHGRGGVGHLLIGSVAERVIRLASCPVVTIRGSGAVQVERGAEAAAERAPAGQAAR